MKDADNDIMEKAKHNRFLQALMHKSPEKAAEPPANAGPHGSPYKSPLWDKLREHTLKSPRQVHMPKMESFGYSENKFTTAASA